MTNPFQQSYQKGFTIVETLVAIAILMIAIAGPLTATNKAFTAALDARNQVVASNLAQEGLEYLSNLKDNGAWPPGGGACTANNFCGVSINPGGSGNVPVTAACSTLVNGCLLTLSNTNLGYTYDTTAIPAPIKTPFTRYFYLTNVSGNDQYLATVVVSWDLGSITNQVQLQEILSDPSYQR